MSLINLGDYTDAKILFDEPMKSHTSYGVGGTADYFAIPKSLSGLNSVIAWCKTHRVKYKIIGAGSNVLFSDLGFRGCIISTSGLNDVFFKLNEVKATSGASVGKLLNFALDNSLGGLENLCGLPASVGGAIVMNASAFGVSISDYIVTVETIKDGKLCRYDKNECAFGYRKSRFLHKKEPVVSATFSLVKADKKLIQQKMKTALETRKKLQPSGRSCGSFFKNPDGDFAGRLIELAGLKGFSVGGACVSEKHANFIVNTGGATANDIYSLAQKIKAEIKKLYGINLTEELEYIGEF